MNDDSDRVHPQYGRAPIVTRANAHVFSLVQRIVDGTLEPDSVGLIVGPIGSGKTHLLCHLRDLLREKGRAVQLIQAAHLDEEVNDGSWASRLEGLEYLLVDDLHEVQAATQRLLGSPGGFTLVGSALTAGVGIKRPIEAVEIEPPDTWAKSRVVEHLTLLENVRFPQEVTDFIVDETPADLRHVQGAVNAVIAHSSLRGVDIDMDVAQHALRSAWGVFRPFHFPGLHVAAVAATKALERFIATDPAALERLTAGEFEEFVAERLEVAGYEVRRSGSVYMPDGGVDLVAWQKNPLLFPFLLAVQVKHHSTAKRRTGAGPVKELWTVVNSRPFQAGLVVTNTSFTPSAAWWASQSGGRVRLRDLEDLRRWVRGSFSGPAEWRDIPDVVPMGRGINIRVR